MDDKGLSQTSERKKALITGASRGIGKAIAVALAACLLYTSDAADEY